MTQIFENPQQFYHHLESRINNYDSLTDEVKKSLLLGCLHSIRYLLESQNLLSEKIYQLVDVLNDHQENWGYKLSLIYSILEAGQVTAQEMNQILIQEICEKKD